MKNLKRLMFVLLLPIFTLTAMFAANGYEVYFNQIGSTEFELNYLLDDYRISKTIKNGITYSKIEFEGSVFITKKGYAELPFIHASVQLSDERNVTIEIVSTDYVEYSLDYPLLPSRGIIFRNHDPSTIPYEIADESIVDEFYPLEIAEATEPFILRDIRGTNVYVYPFQYNAARNILRVYTNVTVKLIENNTFPINPITVSYRRIVREMDSIYRSIFINYDLSRFEHELADFGSILVIRTPRDVDVIAPYIQWKREKGFTVYEEEVATGTNVTSLVSTQYTAHNDILYVQLVGDWADIQGPTNSYGSPTDPNLGCVVGGDVYPDLIIGRFCANNTTHVTTQVNKTIIYEREPEMGAAWYETATGIASNQGAGIGDDGEIDYEHLDVIWNDKLDPFTYETYYPIYDPTANATMVASALNTGTGIINYTGHGSPTSWGTSGFSNTHIANLTNGDMLPFIVSVACNNGEFHTCECFSEAWLHKQNGGAIGMYASTTGQSWAPPMRGQDYFNDLLIGGYDYSLHPGQNGISTDVQKTTYGALCFNGSILMTVEEYTGGLPMMETWTLFGDAALQVRTDPPSLLTLSNEVVLMGVDFTTIITANGTLIEGILVSLYQDGVAYTGFTDETGYVSISHSLIAGDAKMIITGFNTETIYNDITVIPPDGAYVIYNSYNLDDSSGNNNGLLDYGETVNLDMSVNNVGNLQATNVIVTITTSDTYVTIIDSTENYGNIPANTIVNIEDAFSFEVANNVPDEHGILFDLEATDGTNTWISNFLITAHAPVLEFVGFYIDDTASGNGDYMWDPGETVDIIVTLANNGSSNAFNVMGELITIDPFVTLNTTGAQPYGDLTFGNTAEQLFNATSDENTPDAHLASFNINITADLGITGSGSFEVQIGGYLIEEYFNSWLPDGWTTTGGTNWGSGSGNYAGGTPPEAEFDWSPSTTATQRLISLPVNTTGSATLELEFKHSVNHYSGTYELRLETTSDGGNTWNVVQTWPAQNLPATTENLIIDNNDVGSDNFQVAWVFDGYSWNINYWYVDDVILGGGAVPCGYIEGIVTLVGGTGNVEDVIVNAGGVTTNPDASGEYTLEVVPGTYDVTAELAGYISQTISGVEVFEDLTTSGIDFTLDVAVPPSNLVATVVTYNDVHLEWDQPVTFLGDTSVPTKAHREKLITANIRKQAEITDKTRDLLGYKIYRDGELIYEITDPSVTTYDDLALDAGEYEYGVTAVYEGGSSIPCPGIVTITLPAPINPVATSIPPDILVEWDAPPIPTRDLSHYKVYRDMVMIADNITDLFYIDTNVPPNSYIYNITAVYDGGWESDFSEDAEVSVVGTDNILIPIRTELTGNYPNPFNPTTTISFSLKEADNVRIDIYNLKGEKVKTLIDNYMEAAYHTVEWNGKDNNDRSVASGIYFYRMCLHPDLSGKAGGRYTSTKKMILLK